MKLKIDCAPSITRVHTLHRIRTVVNYVIELTRKKIPVIDDIAIADHLIRTHLSKPTTDSFRDQIGRRARDHLETARYLGLLYREKIEGKYSHLPTSLGMVLFGFKFEEECPKNLIEEAIFIDRICRLKLSSTSYLQTPRGYEDFRTRICLNILAALNLNNKPLSIFQLGTILSNRCLDIFFHEKNFELLIDKVNSKTYKVTYLEKLKPEDIRNIRRDTLPFIDWCEQVDLVRKKEEFVNITDRGKEILAFYKRMMPLWWQDFKEWHEVVAGIIILINYFKTKGEKHLIKKMLRTNARFGLYTISIEKILRTNLNNYYKDAIESNLLFDFSFYYDVPPEKFEDVKETMQTVLDKLGEKGDKVSASAVIKHWESYCIHRIGTKLEKEAAEATEQIKSDQKIDVPIINKSILGQLKSPFEATTYIHFKAIEADNFKIEKYQAQLNEFFIDNPQYNNFSKNNPDLLLTNDFWGLVECKSVKEWGDTLSLRKGIISEIEFYHNYCHAVQQLGIKKNCRVIISYEGQIKAKDKKEIIDLIKEKYPNIIIITYSVLQKALVDNSTKHSLRSLAKGTEKGITL